MYFYYYFWPLNNDRLNLRTNPHNICYATTILTRELGVPVAITVCDFGEIPTVVWCAKSRACNRIWVRAMISLKNSHWGFATQDESKFKTLFQ